MTCPATHTDPDTGAAYPCRSIVGAGHNGYHWCRPPGSDRDVYWLTETEAELSPLERRVAELEEELRLSRETERRLRALLAEVTVDP